MTTSHSSKTALLTIVAALALVLAGLVSTPAAAVPNAPGGLVPSSESISGNPVLQWNRVNASASYRVEVSTSAEFDTLLWSTTTTNRRATPTVHLPAGEVWWRVRTTDSTGDSPWTTTSFDRSSIAGPTLVSPGTGVLLEQPTQPALLSWTAINGATSYTIEIDTADDFIAPTTYSTKTSSYVVPNPQIKTTYYWHVQANFGGGVISEWSETRTYNLGGLAAVEGPVSPVMDEQVEDVVLEWSPVLGAKTYDLQVSTDVNFLTFDGGVQETAVTGTTYSPPVSLNNDQYYWRVRPVDNQGNKLDWGATDTWRFQRHWPRQPALEYPVDDAVVGDPFHFQWKAVRHASSYVLQMSAAPDFNVLYDQCTTAHTTFVPVNEYDCWPGAYQSYYWRVIGVDGPQTYPTDISTDFISAEVGHFTYSPELVTSVSPADGATVPIPTLSWNAVAGAARYEVTITATDGGSGGGSWTTAALSYTPRSKLTPDKTYRWQVQTVSDSGRLGPAYFAVDQDLFTVEAMPTPTASTPDAVAPTNGSSSVRFPGLRWEPVVGATSYKVYVRRAGNVLFTLVGSFAYPAGVDDGDDWLADDDYEWRVEASVGGLQIPGAIGTFSIDSLGAATGQRIAITAEALNSSSTSCSTALPNRCQDMRQTPVLRWDAKPDAGFYMVYVSRDAEMTNILDKYPKRVESNHWMSPSTLLDSQAGSAYYWVIQACTSGDACAALTHATHAFNKRTNGVELTSPAAGEVVPDDITFVWGDYLDTNQDTNSGTRGANVDVTGVNARLEARQYRVQVSADPNFQTTLETAVVDQMTFTSYNTTYPEGPIYWRVQAIDGSNNPMAWSDVIDGVPVLRKFTKSSPTPALESPINNEHVSGTHAFSWDPLLFAGSYDVEVYKNGDTLGTSTNRVVTGTSKQVAFTLTTPLPASTEPYTWRVRRVDAEGRKGSWSNLADAGARFRVVGTEPTLLAPTASAFVAGNESLFVWQALAGVTSYRFERRAVGSTSNAETVTTASLAWAPTRAIVDGSWEWRVSTIDAGGKVLATSAWRGFRVDSTRPTVTRWSPKSKADRKTNFVVKFSERVTNVSSVTMKIYRKGVTSSLSAKVTLSSDGRQATLNPASKLQSKKVHTIKLTNAITDTAGNRLVGTSWKVTTR